LLFHPLLSSPGVGLVSLVPGTFLFNRAFCGGSGVFYPTRTVTHGLNFPLAQQVLIVSGLIHGFSGTKWFVDILSCVVLADFRFGNVSG